MVVKRCVLVYRVHDCAFSLERVVRLVVLKTTLSRSGAWSASVCWSGRNDMSRPENSGRTKGTLWGRACRPGGLNCVTLQWIASRSSSPNRGDAVAARRSACASVDRVRTRVIWRRALKRPTEALRRRAGHFRALSVRAAPTTGTARALATHRRCDRARAAQVRRNPPRGARRGRREAVHARRRRAQEPAGLAGATGCLEPTTPGRRAPQASSIRPPPAALRRRLPRARHSRPRCAAGCLAPATPGRLAPQDAPSRGRCGNGA